MNDKKTFGYLNTLINHSQFIENKIPRLFGT